MANTIETSLEISPATAASPATRGRGRPRKVDEATRRKICVLVSIGCDLRQAAFHAGCSYPTIRRETMRHAEFRLRLRQALKLKTEINARCSVDSQYRHSISELQKRLCVTPTDFNEDPTTANTQPP
jgi:hypothetical protein